MAADPLLPELRDRLIKYADQLEADYGCEHTSAYGEWCVPCREANLRLLRDAAAALDPGWRSIDTAPKDGTEIIVHDEGAVFLAFWSVEDEAWIDLGCQQAVNPPPQDWLPLPPSPSRRDPRAGETR